MGSAVENIGGDIVNSVWNAMIQWLYETIYTAVGELFEDINNLGAEIFDLSWVQAMIRLFTLLGWTLFIVGIVVAVFEIAMECQNGRVNLQGSVLNVLKGFFAASLVGTAPVQLYKLCCSLQGIFTGDLAGIFAAEQHSSIGQFAGNMIEYYTVWAHQIKTPIASMRLHLQNEDSTLSRKLSSDLFRIEQYADMVLTFLRLDSDSTDYVFKEYDLDKIVKSAVKKFSSEFINRKLRLVYAPLNTTVVTDEKWLSFVIEQVLSNALKYTPSGSITISLVGEKTLRIEDTGIGIAPEDLPRIFENGYTGYNGRTDQKASGIGLYLCKRICTNLGHTITASSTVDVGTVIDIDLAQRKLDVE